MTVTRIVARATGALLVSCLSTTAAFAGVGLVAYAGEDGTVGTAQQCDIYIAGVATGAHHGPLQYRWLDGATELSPWKGVLADGSAPVELCGLSIGRHTLTLEVTDGETTASDTTIVAVSDTTPPALAARASKTFLCPPTRSF